MITGISIENVKASKNKTEIEIAPLTILIGKNGSGKSVFLQVLALLKQNYRQNHLNDGDFVRLGSYLGMASDNAKSIRIVVKGSVEVANVEPFPYLKNLDYEVELEYPNEFLGSIRVRLAAKNLTQELKTLMGIGTNVLCDLKRDFREQPSSNDNSFFYDTSTNAMIRPVAVSVSNNAKFEAELFIVGAGNTPRDKLNTISRVLRGIAESLEPEFSRISYIPALRGIDTNQYQLLESDRLDFVYAQNFNHQARILLSSIAMNREAETVISQVLEEILDRQFRFRILPNNQVSGETYNGEKWVNIINEGFGANPLIHLITQLVTAPKNAIVLIEEPEVHLHPKAQKKLMSILTRIAKMGNKSLLITTHSEHIILPYVKRISDSGDTSGFKIYVAEKESSAGSKITEVAKENASGILKEFLSVSIDDIASILELSGRG